MFALPIKQYLSEGHPFSMKPIMSGKALHNRLQAAKQYRTIICQIVDEVYHIHRTTSLTLNLSADLKQEMINY